ncbi:MAG: PH domain-containing protein [Bacilli bacterium]
MINSVYEKVREFKRKYPMTVAWRLKANSKIVEQFLNPGEEVLYSFTAQKNDNPLDIVTTCVVTLTNKRILIGQKRVIFGFLYSSITPDMFNDLKIHMGLIWGKVTLDTVNELVTLTNIQKEALPEIETNISEYIIREKKKYTINKTELT